MQPFELKRIVDELDNELHDRRLLKNKGVIEYFKNRKTNHVMRYGVSNDVLIEYIISSDESKLKTILLTKLDGEIKASKRKIDEIKNTYLKMEETLKEFHKVFNDDHI